MAYAHLSRVEGVVASVIDGTSFTVRLPDGRALPARMSRRLSVLQKQHAVGDPVLVGMLSEGNGKGLILTRGGRTGRQPGSLNGVAQPHS